MSASQNKKGLPLAAQRCLVGEMVCECDSDMFQVLRAGDDGGDPKVAYLLGMCYNFGWGTARDMKAAIYGYARATELGSIDALDRLYSLRNNKSVKTDLQNAFRGFCRKADQGDIRAQFNIGYCHYQGIGTPEDKKKARYLFQMAAGQGCADAMRMLDWCRYFGVGDGYNGMQEIELLKYAAELGNADAQNELGFGYLNGKTVYGLEVEKDFKQAVEWFQKAIDQNHTEATDFLAQCYYLGYGVQKDIKKAFQLWKKAALMGYERAQDKISDFYRHEYFDLSEDEWPVDIDYYEAAYWNRKAVDQNQDKAKKNMPDILKPIGLIQDQIDELMKQTSSFESAKTWYNIAKQYEAGDGVEKDEQKAFEIYRLSARFGSAEGQVALARCYEQGIGTEDNILQFMYWNIRAAMQDNTEAAQALQKWLQQSKKQSEFKYREQLLTYAINAVKEISPQHDPDLEIIQLIVEDKKEQIALLLGFFSKDQDPPDKIKTFETCKLAVEYDMRAVYWMVRHHQHSTNIADDFGGIPQRLQKEVASGDAETAYCLARCHMLELGTPKNEIEAKNCYEFAVEEDHPAAQHELGRFYQDGTVVEQSIYKAIELYNKAADQNYIPALKTLAEIFESNAHQMKDLNRAFQYHKRAAQLNDADEQLLIAECYRYGRIVQKSDKDALHWYEKAAANGKYECYKQVAECYEKGIGTVANQQLVFKAYMQLATAIPTQDNLIKVAGMLEAGTGTQKDILQAVKYYERAGANSKLGDIYFAGKGIPRNLETALNYYKKV